VLSAIAAFAPCTTTSTASRTSGGSNRACRRDKRKPDDRTLVFCQVGRFVDFYGPQRQQAAAALRLVRVKIGRAGYASSVGFPTRLRQQFLARALGAGQVVADARESGGALCACAEREAVVVWGCRGSGGYDVARNPAEGRARRLETIRERIAAGEYVVSFTHTEKLRRRRIGADEIERAIQNGTIIEDYPGDPRGPSCLILGHAGERPVHVVCGRMEAEEILIITAYQPDAGEWEPGWAKRRR